MDSHPAAAPHLQQRSKPITIRMPTIPSFNDLNTLAREDTEPIIFDRSWSGSSSVESHADTPRRYAGADYKVGRPLATASAGQAAITGSFASRNVRVPITCDSGALSGSTRTHCQFIAAFFKTSLVACLHVAYSLRSIC